MAGTNRGQNSLFSDTNVVRKSFSLNKLRFYHPTRGAGVWRQRSPVDMGISARLRAFSLILGTATVYALDFFTVFGDTAALVTKGESEAMRRQAQL